MGKYFGTDGARGRANDTLWIWQCASDSIWDGIMEKSAMQKS